VRSKRRTALNGLVFRTPHSAFRTRVVRQFHHVVKIILVPADLENVDEAFVRTRDGLELLDAIELALEGTAILEIFAIDNFYGSVAAQCVTRQPHLAVSATTDTPQQLMLMDGQADTRALVSSWCQKRRRSSLCGPRMHWRENYLQQPSEETTIIAGPA
jgi:hypothetical protein